MAAEVLTDAVSHILATERSLVIDLEATSFADRAAVLPIVRALRSAVKHGRDVRLINVPRSVQRLAHANADIGDGLRLGTRRFVSLSN